MFCMHVHTIKPAQLPLPQVDALMDEVEVVHSLADYCTDCRPAGTERATVRLCFQLKECCTACEAVLKCECKLLPLISN